MNCEEYLELDYHERMTLVGKAFHLLENDPDSFRAISSMVRSAEQQGKLSNVKFGNHEIHKEEQQ